MSKIIVEKINEVYIKLHTEPAVLEELSEFFTFQAPDFQYTTQARKYHWDGKIKLFNKRTKQLYAGLGKHLEEFAKDRNYKIEGLTYESKPWSLKESEEFIEDLKLTAHGKPIKPHEHQIMAITKALRYVRRVILSPTNSGKSLIAYVIVRHLLQNNFKGIIIVPTIGLVEQLYKDFEDYSSANGWDVSKHVHKIYQGQDKFANKDLIISTWQSIYDVREQDEDYFKKFDYVIGDEAHMFKAKSLSKIMTSLTNAKYRIGMSGTLHDAVVHKLSLEGYFGPITKVATNKELMDKKISAELTIKALVLKYSQEDAKQVYKKDYHQEIEFLVLHKKRNNFITNLSLSLNKTTLVLFQYVEKHGKQLFQMIQDKNKDPNRKIFFVSGGTELEDRESIRQIVDNHKSGIKLSFDFGTILLPFDLEIPLVGGKKKISNDLTQQDDIDDDWLKREKYKYLLNKDNSSGINNELPTSLQQINRKSQE